MTTQDDLANVNEKAKSVYIDGEDVNKLDDQAKHEHRWQFWKIDTTGIYAPHAFFFVCECGNYKQVPVGEEL